jgi:uncharacterized LabA/DUF88 family protein
VTNVSFFIDGLNVYYSLKRKYSKYLWLDFCALANRFVRKGDNLTDIFYFSAYATWRKPDEISRQRLFIDVLENSGVKVVLGK